MCFALGYEIRIAELEATIAASRALVAEKDRALALAVVAFKRLLVADVEYTHALKEADMLERLEVK